MLHPDAAPKCCSLAKATIHPLKPEDTPVPELRLSLSGDATQATNPWSWFVRTVESQVGSISMNLGKLADPVLEERIVNEFGNSGTQIGQLGDALPVLLGHTRLGGFAPGEQRLAV